MSKNKARIVILNSLLSYPTISNKDWNTDYTLDVQVGDLVSISSAPYTKWYLSWVRDIKNKHSWPEYLLESIEDSELSWWSNIGFNIYNRERVKENITWQWNDEQFEFYDKWKKVCYTRNNAYMLLPKIPIFNEDGSVVLDVRVRFSMFDYKNHTSFPNWKKLTMKKMDEYYKQCFKEYELRIKGESSIGKEN